MNVKIILLCLVFLLVCWHGSLVPEKSVGLVWGQEVYPGLSITADTTYGTVPLTVNFTAAVTDPYSGQYPITFDWYFGDGAASTKQNPRHIYTAAGTYAVTCQATLWKSPKIVVEDTLQVIVLEKLNISISPDPSSGEVPLAVGFTSTVTGGVGSLTYQWDFGDGKTSSSADPGHTFTTAGIYAVTCTVTDSATPPRSKQASAQIEVYEPFTFSIAADSTSREIPLTVNFISTVTGGFGSLTYQWDFGDGSTSSTANPGHIFKTHGIYTVTCTVTDSATPPRTKQATVQIEVYEPLNVSIFANPPSGEVPLEAGFTSTVTGGFGSLTYQWDFDDGSTSSAANPAHTFKTHGTYTVTCMVTDSATPPRTAQATVQIEVYEPLNVSIFANPLSGEVPLEVGFTSTVTGDFGNLTYQWAFDDGSTSSAANPGHIFKTHGIYTVTCTVTDSATPPRTKQATVQIEVYEPLNVSIFANPPSGLQPLEVGFTSTVTGGFGSLTYQWDFDDESALSNEADPTHAFTTAGTYAVTCQVTDSAAPPRTDQATTQIDVISQSNWPVAVSTAPGSQYAVQIAPDGSGGAVMAWHDQRGGTYNDIYAQRVDQSGKPLWSADGVAVCTANYSQQLPQITAGLSGSAIITWCDSRSGHYDIYAQRVNRDGTLE